MFVVSVPDVRPSMQTISGHIEANYHGYLSYYQTLFTPVSMYTFHLHSGIPAHWSNGTATDLNVTSLDSH